MKDITGQRFGSLVAVRHSHTGKNYMQYWVYKCDCGKEHTARSNTVAYELRKGDPELPSCGCVELARKTAHGFRKKEDTHPAYRAYRSMMTRCYDSNSPNYKWYGAVGVTVCDEWRNSPKAFVEWALANGWDKSLHLDKDILCKSLGVTPHIYSPATCQWVTAQTNVSAATNRDNFGKHPNVKLSHDVVKEIVELYSSGQLNGPELAARYGVGTTAIYNVIHAAKKQGQV